MNKWKIIKWEGLKIFEILKILWGHHFQKTQFLEVLYRSARHGFYGLSFLYWQRRLEVLTNSSSSIPSICRHSSALKLTGQPFLAYSWDSGALFAAITEIERITIISFFVYYKLACLWKIVSKSLLKWWSNIINPIWNWGKQSHCLYWNGEKQYLNSQENGFRKSFWIGDKQYFNPFWNGDEQNLNWYWDGPINPYWNRDK